MAAEAGLCLAWSETPEDTFCRSHKKVHLKSQALNLESTACVSEQRRFWWDCADAQAHLNLRCSHMQYSGRLGRAMVLGSFQCRGILLLWHMVGQGPAVLAAGVGRVGCFFIFFISSVLFSFSNASSLERRLDILKYFTLGHYNPTVVVSNYWRHAHSELVNRLVGLSLPRNSVTG